MIRNTLTGKQKRFLRALGTKLEPVVTIGKEGVTPTVVESARDVIAKRELIKVRVLQNAPELPKDAVVRLTERADDRAERPPFQAEQREAADRAAGLGATRHEYQE